MRSSRVVGLVGASVLLGSAVTLVAGPAAARQEACLGQAATQVGEPGRVLRGTPGPDVLVSNGAYSVNAGGGDDLVCVTGTSPGQLLVNTGPGDDVLDTTAAGVRAGFVELTLGQGADRLQGGPLDENVVTGTRTPFGDEGRSDDEVDVVDAGAGDDQVESGDPTSPNGDVVRLGPGNDVALWNGTRHVAGGTVDGGPGTDQLTLGRARGDWRLDNAAGLATLDGVPMASWSQLERFDASALVGSPDPLAFVGSDGDDALRVAFPVAAEMGAGDDVLEVARTGPTGRYDGGPGTDLLVLLESRFDLTFDMPRGRLVLRAGDGGVRRRSASAFEQLLAGSRGAVRVTGTAGPNAFLLSGCDVRVDAGAGADSVGLGYGVPCRAPGTRRVRGGPGDDLLFGSAADDELLGGPGRDRAFGRRGDDLCRAERTAGCER